MNNNYLDADIRIDQKGIITTGDDSGCYVIIKDDSRNTGGFLILVAEDSGFLKGYDHWVNGLEQLKEYFKTSCWTIKWL